MKQLKIPLISVGVIALIIITFFVGRSSGITKEQVTARVEALPEVIEYQAMLAKAGAKATIETIAWTKKPAR